ncbi:insulin-like growth factor-binding protein-like 1 [Peromyscus californicus insignis]|uniref:insulin-like growth factor-binding protein-like 1 n=1 Tax=Peromyscus californicus insignis TaxID=564181 RepID=UPI0022A7A215|nr:insulin-like growth factor-binding protein-like 1 [Peromyscus californicus insignis]
MPRLPLLLLLLPSLTGGLGLRDAGRRHPECSPCRLDRCPVPSPCPAPWIAARDECGCCARCLGAEGASCGGRVGARCGPGLVCASRAAGTAPEGTGLCVCAQRGTVCGSDGRSYSSICALRLRARHAPRMHPGHLHKARDGPCEFAPVVLMPPRDVHNVTGAQVFLSCEVKAVPTPVITWKKVVGSPEGTEELEELPGDHVNIAVQVRGGPSDHETTSWILINPLRKEDEGVYHCHAANAIGEAQSHSTVTVLDLSRYKSLHSPVPADLL